MLTRATRQSIQCPPISQYNPIPSYRATRANHLSSRWIRPSTTAAIPPNRRAEILQDSRSSLPHALNRSISTATDSSTLTASSIPPVLPWDSSFPPPSAPSQWDHSFLPHLNVQSTGTILQNRRRKDLGFNVEESLKNLRACLTVGRFDRAETIIRKLAKESRFQRHEIQEANNHYVRAFVHSLFRRAPDFTLSGLHIWFELEMRQLEIAPDATTFALLIRSSFLIESQKARDRTIRRYLSMAENMGLLEDTMSSGEYLPEAFNMICSLNADLFQQIPQEPIPESEPAVDDTPTEEVTTQATPSDIHIEPVPQRGLGLKAIIDSMQVLRDGSVLGSNVPDAIKRGWQIRLERDLLSAEMERWKFEHAEMLRMGINPALTSKSMEATLWEWQLSLKKSLQEHLNHLIKSPDYVTGGGPYLEMVGAEKLAAITIMTTLRVLTRTGIAEGAPLYRIANSIGAAIESHCLSTTTVQASTSKYRKQHNREALFRKLRKRTVTGGNSRSVDHSTDVQRVAQISREKQLDDWPDVVKVKASAMLVSKLIEIARLPAPKKGDGMKHIVYQRVQAFHHVMERSNGKRKGMLKACHQLVEALVNKSPSVHSATQLPMVAKPEPWSDFKGAYLQHPASLMRTKDPSGIQDMYAHAAIQEGNLDQLFAGLNVLGKTEWRINRPLFDVMVEAWNTGEAFTNFPPANPILDLPPRPETDDKRAMSKWRTECRRLENEHSGFHSNRCFLNLQMEIGKAFADHTFYLPHNIDFRGRAYPVGGIFHHMGADNARALFQFAQGKELGDQGFFWLKVHLANTFGFDKASLGDRAQFVMDHIDDIRDSVTNPLSGRRWWTKAEDPWQCLATSYEVIAAIDSPDPTKFVSHQPIHQDGTCNGLQHYAALGGDMLGAAQVNLIPGKKPADIYSAVAELVIEQIEGDAAQGNAMAAFLKGKITRKVVKQPVMTYVYGVTFFGAREQIQKRLDEIIPPDLERDFNNFDLAIYIVKKVFKSFGVMFQGASNLQTWLVECADRISRAIDPEQIDKLHKIVSVSEKKPKRGNAKKSLDAVVQFQNAVVWTTPLKLSVVQPYRKIDTRKHIITPLQRLQVSLPNESDTVHRRKQIAGFPPNFIHSLDATHMLMSALKCDEAGLTFASVHDSFWTHACDIPAMSKALREAFIQIHSEDIIGRLEEEFQTRYQNFLMQKEVESDSGFAKEVQKLLQEWQQELRKCKKGARGRAIKMTDELEVHILLKERERMRLLNADCEKERELGRKMVTPGSLYAQLSSETADNVAVKKETPSGEILRGISDQALNTSTTPETFDEDAEEVEVEKASKKKARRKHLKVWIPLTFPPVPKKGDFDVRVLRDSPYFFS